MINQADLNIDTSGALHITPKTLIGMLVAVLGITRSGKSNTAAVLIEELLSLSIPVCIVDIEGEYWGLKQHYEILVVGNGANIDVAIGPQQAAALARFSYENRLPIILDVSEFEEDQRDEFVLNYFTALYSLAFAQRKPYVIVLEEAHEFVPQGRSSKLKTIMARIALRGGKRGLTTILSSQRSAKVDKDVLTQASVYFLHRVRHPVDIRVYQDAVPLPAGEVETMIAGLGKGQAIVLYDEEITLAQVRLRETFHVGATPTLTESALPELRTIDAGLLAELRELAQHAEPESSDPEELRQRIKQLEMANAALKRQLDDRLAGQQKPLPIEAPAMPGNAPLKVIKPRLTPTPTADARNASTPYEKAIAREERRFADLVARVKKWRGNKREVLAFLMEREDKTYTIGQLARETGILYSTLANNQPGEAVHLGMLTRQGKGESSEYSSNMWKFLEDSFPNLPTLTIYNDFLEQLKAGIR